MSAAADAPDAPAGDDLPARPVRALLDHGVEVHFVQQGAGVPVLLLHGGMGDLGSWAPQQRTLAPRHRVVCYSRRHSSPNRNPDPGATHAIDDDVHDLRALLGVLDIDAAHLVGTSYGALVALAFAVQHPARTLGLVLAEPPLHRWACASTTGTRLYQKFVEQVWRRAGESFALGHERRALQLLTDGIWGRPTFDTLTAARIESALRNSAAMRALTHARDPFPCLDRRAVAALPMPALLVHGEHASALHRCVMNELAGVMRRARRVEIAAAGHGSPSENPAAFDAAMVDFLDSVPPSDAPPLPASEQAMSCADRRGA